jgi:hypothetical protein
MKLHGSLEDNLESAVRSAQRLHGQRVYPETLQHWDRLIAMARSEMSAVTISRSVQVASLADQLELEIKAFRGDE